MWSFRRKPWTPSRRGTSWTSDRRSGSSDCCHCCYERDNFVLVASVLLAEEQVFVVWEEALGERSTLSVHLWSTWTSTSSPSGTFPSLELLRTWQKHSNRYAKVKTSPFLNLPLAAIIAGESLLGMTGESAGRAIFTISNRLLCDEDVGDVSEDGADGDDKDNAGGGGGGGAGGSSLASGDGGFTIFGLPGGDGNFGLVGVVTLEEDGDDELEEAEPEPLRVWPRR